MKETNTEKLIYGQWYWITYPYIEYTVYQGAINDVNRSSTELKRCLATKDDGINGLFYTDILNKKWIGISHCSPYSGKMRPTSFWSWLFNNKEDQEPDI